MNIFDLYNLPDEVLFKSNDSFYDFVTQTCSDTEAKILKIQGIRNAQCLLRSRNILDILELDCEEVNEIKPHACFLCKDGTFIIRQGVKLNLEYLYDALKDKHEKYKKKIQRQRQQQQESVSHHHYHHHYRRHYQKQHQDQQLYR